MMRGWLLALLILGLACKSRKPGAEDQTQAAPHVVAPAVMDAAPEPVPDDMALPPPPPMPDLPRHLPERPERLKTLDTPARVALGTLLFFDPRLSRDSSMSCASCHDPDKGWSDGRERALTIAGKPNLRHTPSLVNLAYAKEFFWDGRMSDLEAMILAHWKGQLLGTQSPGTAIARLATLPAYGVHMRRAFGHTTSVASAEDIAQALAAFVRTIYSGDSPWDRYEAGDRAAVSEDAVAGFAIFTQKAQCALCHPPPLYTDSGYHDVGVGALGPDNTLIDLGRSMATGVAEDEGAFKTPTLRGLGHSAPYYHDGSAATLTETLDHGLRAAARHAAPGTVPARLSEEETQKLLAFLQALTPEAVPYARPRLPNMPEPGPAEPGSPGARPAAAPPEHE